MYTTMQSGLWSVVVYLNTEYQEMFTIIAPGVIVRGSRPDYEFFHIPSDPPKFFQPSGTTNNIFPEIFNKTIK